MTVTQQRSLETQKLLIDATFDTIHELGYHGTSTIKIIERAGLSRGAMLHHFPTRNDLIVAMFQALHDGVRRDVVLLIEQAEAGGEHWSELLDLIFGRFFKGAQWEVFLEIMVATRTDANLWQRLVPTVIQYYADVDEVWHQHFTTSSVDSEAATLLNLSLCLMRGMAVQMLLRDDPSYYENMMRQWKQILTPLLQTKKDAAPNDVPS